MKQFIIVLLALALCSPAHASKVIVVNDGDGIAVIHPVVDRPIEETLAEALNIMGVDDTDYILIDSEDLPDREYRKFWERKGNKVEANIQKYDLDKAKKESKKSKIAKAEKYLEGVDLTDVSSMTAGKQKKTLRALAILNGFDKEE